MQGVIVAIIVSIAALQVLRRVAPSLVWRWQWRLNRWLAAHPGWRAALAKRLAPRPVVTACAARCTRCDGCSS